jgi:predicted aspartyl protease
MILNSVCRIVHQLMIATILVFLILFIPGTVFAIGLNERTEFIISKTISIVAVNTFGSDPLGNLESVTIPLKRVGKLFLIEARIDNETGNFVFDTGSSKLVLNKTYFRKYLCSESESSGGVTGSTAAISHIQIKRLQIAGLGYDNLPADVTNLGHIENRRGVKILGLFGFALLKNLEIVIDVNRNELRLYRIDKYGNRINNSRQGKFDITQKIEKHQNIIFVQAKIGGKMLDFCLDTGAESNVLNCFASRKVLSTISIQRRSDLVGVGAARSEVLYGVMNDFTFGDRTFTNMQTIITNLESMSESYGITIDGMLGYDFFCQGEICINMVKNELGVWLAKKEKP